MAIKYYEDIAESGLQSIAEKMLLAAKTAPKGRGTDNMVYALIDGEDINKLSEKTKEIGKQCDINSFLRDSENILKSQKILLLGTKIKPLGLKKCGLCGFGTCEGKSNHPDTPCVFNTGDLGIAIGSAVSIAADNRIDNRIMYTIGMAVKDLGIFDKDVKIVYAIPLSATSKSPFFDRK